MSLNDWNKLRKLCLFGHINDIVRKSFSEKIEEMKWDYNNTDFSKRIGKLIEFWAIKIVKSKVVHIQIITYYIVGNIYRNKLKQLAQKLHVQSWVIFERYLIKLF